MCWVLVAFDVDGCMMHSSMVYYPSGACGVRGLLAMPDAPAQLSPDEVLALSVLRGCMVAGLAISS